jgi:carbamoyltransferase
LKDQFSEGKAMALSSFGKMNTDYYNKIIFQNHFNKNYIIANHSQNINPKKIFSGNFNTDIDNKDAQDLAFTFQKACEFMAIQFIKKLKINNDITISGGVGQNILINSMLSKEFNFNIYVDPICDDQGISLGRLNHFLNFKLEKEKGVYLGFKPKYELEIFNNNFKINDCSIKEAAKVVNSFPMAIFQGRSEQGQRALGNRSLLMNATHPECISLINKIKKREWYRPFACSILYEEISNWFINNIKQDPEYMMFVYTAKEDKLTFLKNVTAKDNTSRIQGVKSTTNKNYYDLLKMYNEEYKIPFLLNTSLNQPGEPIVETLYDLKNMMLNTSLNYAYLPEIKKIIIKTNDK